MAFTTDKWIGKSNADWGASSNWSRGLPNSDSNVVISTPTVLTVSFSGADNFTVHSLVVGDDVFDMTGGTLAIATTASFAGGFTQTGGILTAGGAVSVHGTGTLTGGGSEGKTAFVFDGTVALANYALGGSTSLSNKKTTNLTGQVILGDNTGVGATIDNEKGGTFAIAGDFGIIQGAATARFINAGTFSKIGGTGTSLIGVDFTDTGSIVVDHGGTIEFAGPANSFAGSISGSGQVVLGAGSKDLIAAGTKISTAAFTISDGGTVVTLDGDLSFAGALTLVNGATLDLAGATLTLSGTEVLNGAVLDGTGVLVTAHGSDTTLNNTFTLGGTNIWENSGTVGEAGVFQLGDSSFNAVSFINGRGGVYEFSNDAGITIGAAYGSSFVNQAGAVLEKTAGSGTSLILAAVTDNGEILVRSGTIDFAGFDNSFAGTITGAGVFEIGGGDNTIAAGTTIKTTVFDIENGSLVTLGGGLSYGRTVNFEGGADLDLAGFTLTLSGTDTFNGVIYDGKGALVTASGSAISLTNVTLGGTLVWENSGTISEFATLQIGDASPEIARFVNERGGVYEFVNDAGITIGAAPTASFLNSAGAVLVKTSGTGDSQVAVDFTNNGKVVVDTGAIEFGNLVNGSGSFSIRPGAVLQFDASVAKGATVDFAAKTGGELVLVDSQHFGSAIKGFGGTDTIDLAAINFDSSRFRMSYNAKKGVLTLTDGAHGATLDFMGNYTLRDFHASADGHGGTLLVDPSPHALLASAR